eukprot:scaffold14600_cov110-Isochrysis_galbana.AAC.2
MKWLPPRTARSKNWMIFRKYPTYRLPSANRWYSVPTKRPEAKQAHAPEIFAIPAEDLREDKKSSQYLPSWQLGLPAIPRALYGRVTVLELCRGFCNGAGREYGWIGKLRVETHGAAMNDGRGSGKAIHIYL